MPDPVLSTLASRLANILVGAATPRLKAKLLGTEHQRALEGVFTAAFAAMLGELGGDGPTRDLVAAQLGDFFRDPAVSAAFVDVALEGREPPITDLRDRFWVAGFDPATFPLDFERAMARLATALSEAMRDEAATGDGTLFNRVALADIERLHERLGAIERALAEPPAAVSHSLPQRPSLLIGRERDLAALRAILGVNGAEPRPLTVVRGWPGVGKTTIAAALANDAAVRERYPDGVLWAALGEEGRASSELSAWAERMGVRVKGATTEQLAGALRGRLEDREMLLVIDDVWVAEEALPFLVAGASSATVVTTRQPEVARRIAPAADDVYVLGVLDEDDALELLGVLAPLVIAEHEAEARELVAELEGLPLAIRVAGALLQAEWELGLGVTELLADLRAGARLLEAQAPPDRAELAGQTTPTVAALLQRSTDLLSPEDRMRFAYLGPFAPKPARFDLSDAAAVWGVEDPRPTVRVLAARGLVEPAGGGIFQIHSLMVMHARSLLGAA